LSGDAEALRKELLGAANRQPGRVERVEPVVKLDLETRGGNTSTRRLDPRPPPEPSPPVLVPSTSGGDATWTLPLEITIRLGQPGLKSSIVGSPASQPIVEKPQPAQRSELQAALAELAEAPTRPYYDEQADMEDQDRYYAGLPSDLNPAELFAALSRLVGAATDNVPRYAPARHLYPWIDLQPDLKIQSVYSGQQFEPEELIRDDFRMEQERAIRLSEIMVREATLSPEEVAAQLDELEAALPYNCEHVVCQSWFGKQEPMRGDLHHLFACESRCNSFRSNTPYYDFPDFMEAVRTECGKSEGERFEPESGKGKVARATLYFLLAYPGKINARFPVYDEERLRILLEWHRQFPVTPHEKHRNAAIFSRQDNRNPLVDYPEWADRIDFALSL
jgi:endonuclease I